MDTVKYILANYGEFSDDNRRGWLIDRLLKYGYSELLEVLVQKYQILPTSDSFTQSFRKLKFAQIKQLYVTYKLRPKCTALSFAICKGEIDVVMWLMTEFGMIPSSVCLNRAIMSGQIEIWRFLIGLCNLTPTTNNIDRLIARGHFDLAQELMTKFNRHVSDKAASLSVQTNNVLALQWLDQHYGIKPANLSFSSKINNLEAVQFSITTLGYQPTRDDVNSALGCHRLEILRYLYDNFQLRPDDQTVKSLELATTDPEIIRFIFEVKPQLSFDQNSVNKIARLGNLKLCQLIYEKTGLYPNKKYCDLGWRSGTVSIYNWLAKVQSKKSPQT